MTIGRLYGTESLTIAELSTFTQFNITVENKFKFYNILIFFSAEETGEPAILIFLLMGKIEHVFVSIEAIENKSILNLQTNVENLENMFLLDVSLTSPRLLESHWLKKSIQIDFMTKSEIDKIKDLPKEELIAALQNNRN